MTGPEPTFFVDRSLGRHRVPVGLRAAGWRLVTLAEHYGVPADAEVLDETWLQLAGDRGWPVLMKDDRIRYRSTERRVLMAAKVVAFCLSSGNLRADCMIQLLVRHQTGIVERARGTGPAFYTVSRGGLRQIELD